MKRSIIFFLSNMLFVALSFSQSITVTSPSGGNPLTKGDDIIITWTSTGITGNVKIRLMKGTGGLEDLVLRITDSTPDDGSFPWTIPASVSPGSYLIRIKTIDNAVDDDGDFFTIKEGSITFLGKIKHTPEVSKTISLKDAKTTSKTMKLKIPVSSPIGGASYPALKSFPIKWDNEKIKSDSKVNIDLYFKDGKFQESISHGKSNSGLIFWAPPQKYSWPGTSYYVQVSNPTETAVGRSGIFSIGPPVYEITIYEPVADGKYEVGKPIKVRWNPNFGSSTLNKKVRFLVCYTNNTIVKGLSSIENTGVFFWTPKRDFNPGMKLFVKISSTNYQYNGKSGLFTLFTAVK